MDNAQRLQDPVTPEQRGERPSQGTARVTGKGQSSCPWKLPVVYREQKKKKNWRRRKLRKKMEQVPGEGGSILPGAPGVQLGSASPGDTQSCSLRHRRWRANPSLWPLSCGTSRLPSRTSALRLWKCSSLEIALLEAFDVAREEVRGERCFTAVCATSLLQIPHYSRCYLAT